MRGIAKKYTTSRPRPDSAGNRGKCALHDGFTLLEILVVLAIILLLVALLFPALERARENGRAASCIANLHQVGLGLAQYADGNDGLLPTAGATIAWDASDPITKRQSWMQQIFPYVRSKETYHCPSDSESAYSYFLSCRAAYLESGGFAATNSRRIEFPAAFVLSGDTAGFATVDADKDDYTQNCVGGAENGIPYEPWQRHNGGQNILFADGHVKRFNAFSPGLMSFGYATMKGWP